MTFRSLTKNERVVAVLPLSSVVLLCSIPLTAAPVIALCTHPPLARSPSSVSTTFALLCPHPSNPPSIILYQRHRHRPRRAAGHSSLSAISLRDMHANHSQPVSQSVSQPVTESRSQVLAKSVAHCEWNPPFLSG